MTRADIEREIGATVARSQLIASCEELGLTPVGEAVERVVERAALVAAAPELLEAARAVVTQWDTPNWKLKEPTAVFINALRRAIAKAEGRS